MWRETRITGDYFNIATDKKDGRVKFAKWDKETKTNDYFNSLNGMVTGVKIKNKLVVPTKWPNANKEIEITELVVSMVDENGNMFINFNLYGWMARNVLNWLAGHVLNWWDIENIKFSIGIDKNGYTNCYITDETKEWDYQAKKLQWIMSTEELKTLKKSVTVNGKVQTDYTGITEKLVSYLDQINEKISWPDETEENHTKTQTEAIDSENIPF